jgi:hypothetical protein
MTNKRPSSATRLALKVRFHINWQWPAIKMQYERLMERANLPVNRMVYEHMLMVADMDFLVIMVRRFLRTAEQARQIPSNNQKQLKLAINVFNSHWKNTIKVRDALEHIERAGVFPVPAASFPKAADGSAEFTFMWPGGNLDLGKLFGDAQSIMRAIVKV